MLVMLQEWQSDSTLSKTYGKQGVFWESSQKKAKTHLMERSQGAPSPNRSEGIHKGSDGWKWSSHRSLKEIPPPSFQRWDWTGVGKWKEKRGSPPRVLPQKGDPLPFPGLPSWPCGKATQHEESIFVRELWKGNLPATGRSRRDKRIEIK